MEYFVDAIAETSPLHTAFLACEMFAKKFELTATKNNLGHVESDSELSLGDKSSSQFVKVSEELRHSDPLLFCELPQLGEHIFDIVWSVSLDVFASDPWPRLWVVIKRMIVASSDSKQLFTAVYIVTEVKVVDFISISFIAVSFQQKVQNLIASVQVALVQNSKELMLGYVLVASDVEILEHLLQVNALDLNSLAVLLQDRQDHLLLLWCHFQILASGWDCKRVSDWLHNCKRIFLDAVCGEGRVNIGAKIDIVEMTVCGAVPISYICHLLLSEFEVHH